MDHMIGRYIAIHTWLWLGGAVININALNIIFHIRPEPIMLLKLPIMLLSNAPKISLLCSNYAQSCPIMP